MDHAFIKINQHVKYESYVINSSQDNDQKALVTLTFNLVNPQS